MFRAVAILCALVIVLVIFEQVSCHGHGRHHHGRHGHHHHHRGPPHHRSMLLNIAIYDPKGIELSTPRLNSTAQYFAFDMFINNPNGTTPDVSHNTSEVVYGKYMVRDTEAIIKPGDLLNITSYMGFSDGGVLQLTTKFYVFRSMIKNNCTCENVTTTRTPPIQSIPPWTRTTTVPTPSPTRYTYTRRPTSPVIRTTTPSTTTPSWNLELANGEFSEELDFDCEIDPTTNLCSDNSLIDVRVANDRARRQPEKLIAEPDRSTDIHMFRDIVNTMNNECRTKARSNYLIMEPYPKLPNNYNDPSIELTQHVRRFLTDVLHLKQLADRNLVSARPNGTVIVFEMETLFDKLQVLYHAKQKSVTTLQDYDTVKGEK
ncbi:uncharacterized protein LOC126564899 [Anopheles maculipalpis]|uniref:uncharacterized protein LOC126564899 n=1 Tax=Anopheles maculipalpis TaxID=1496333 RepID=UPI0021595816|nr:uncharacterized protein LOC126564899 [Anopheles maculipalpis]